MGTRSRTRRGAALALTLLLALAALAQGCRRASQGNANGAAPPPTQAQGGAGEGASGDVARLNADIDALERQAERNPADDETRHVLARAYVRRGDARRGAGQWREALADYQSALRLDPDNDAAQAGAAATTEQLGGEQKEDENGAPAPLPITPNVADQDEKTTPTPKKSDK